MGKGEIARNEQFLLFPQCFLPVQKPCAIFILFEIVVCKLFEARRSGLKCVVWERPVKTCEMVEKLVGNVVNDD